MEQVFNISKAKEIISNIGTYKKTLYSALFIIILIIIYYIFIHINTEFVNVPNDAMVKEIEI